MQIIGLIGKKGAGKGTVAEALAGIGYKELAFADGIYEQIAEAFDISVDTLKVRETKETALPALKLTLCKDNTFYGIALEHCMQALKTPGSGGFLYHQQNFWLSPRLAMQLWGTEYRRKQDNLYWVKQLHSKLVNMAFDGVEKFCLSDIREPHETDYTMSVKGTLWKIERPDNPYEKLGTSNHSSETQVGTLPYNHLVLNNSDIQSLVVKAVDLERLEFGEDHVGS